MCKGLLFYLIVSSTLTVIAVPVANPSFCEGHRVLVSASSDCADRHLSWPKIVRTQSGALILAYSAGLGHNQGASGLAVSVSRDQGISFPVPKTLRRFPSDDARYRDCGNLAIGIAADGAVVLLAMAYHGDQRNTVFGYRSADEGLTWEPLDTTCLSENKTGSVFGHVSRLPDNSLVVFGHYRTGSSPYENGLWISRSYDHGRTWKPHQRILKERMQEPAVIWTEKGFVGLLRSWGGRADYSLLTSEDRTHWLRKENAFNQELIEGRGYPSPFLACEPALPSRLWALESFRHPTGKTERGGIVLWTADLRASGGLAEVIWRKVARLISWKASDTDAHPDFSYPWMTFLGDGRWLMVYYSGQTMGQNDIYGCTLRLDPERGEAVSAANQ
jgi:hypothetical protein